MAKRGTPKITSEQTTSIAKIVEHLSQAAKEIDRLEIEAIGQQNPKVYTELINAIHDGIGPYLYNMKKTITDADDPEMRSPK